MFFETISKIKSEIKNLEPFEMEKLFLEMLEERIIDFVGLANLYVRVLEEQKNKLLDNSSRLVLMLGVYAGQDKSHQGATARKYIYESGYYTEKDGSGFGKQLYEEFKKDEPIL